MSFADDFSQIYHLYRHDEGIIISNTPASLFRFDDFEYDQYSIEDFYFSVPRLWFTVKSRVEIILIFYTSNPPLFLITFKLTQNSLTLPILVCRSLLLPSQENHEFYHN